jgi:hypothetical protein
MSDTSPIDTRPTLLARCSVPVFALLCVGISVASSIIAFLVFAIGIAIFDAAVARDPGTYESLALIVAALVGLLITIAVLVRKRRAGQGQIRSKAPYRPGNVGPPEIAARQDAAILAALGIDNHTNEPSLASQNPPPLDVVLLGAGEDRVASNTALGPEISTRNADAETNWRSFRPRVTVGRLIASAGIFAAGLLVVAFFLVGAGDQGLEVRAGGDTIMITNLRNDPAMKVLDVIVNNRDECSTDRSYSVCRSMPNATSPAFIAACSRLARFDRPQLHALWVYGGVNIFDNVFASAPISLKIGDSHSWVTACPRVIQVQIVTDKSTATYSFSD